MRRFVEPSGADRRAQRRAKRRHVDRCGRCAGFDRGQKRAQSRRLALRRVRPEPALALGDRNRVGDHQGGIAPRVRQRGKQLRQQRLARRREQVCGVGNVAHAAQRAISRSASCSSS